MARTTHAIVVGDDFVRTIIVARNTKEYQTAWILTYRISALPSAMISGQVETGTSYCRRASLTSSGLPNISVHARDHRLVFGGVLRPPTCYSASSALTGWIRCGWSPSKAHIQKAETKSFATRRRRSSSLRIRMRCSKTRRMQRRHLASSRCRELAKHA